MSARSRPTAMPAAPSRSTLATAGVLALLAVGACGQVDDRPATWSYLSPAIFQPSCASTSCHGPAAAVSGLDFSTPERGYTSLTSLWSWVVVAPDAGAPPSGVPCATIDGTFVCEQMLRPLVTPYDPAGSRLVNMLRARDAPRMPPDRPLTEPDIELVERWILNGACESGVSCGADAGVGSASPPADASGGGG
jgi:hypothetical protein